MKIIISHPTGNANTRAAIDGLYKANLLHSFHTCVAVFSNSWFYNFCIGPLRVLRKRSFSTYLKPYTYKYPFRELLRNLKVSKVNVDKVYHNLDNNVSQFILKHYDEIDAVYAYDDGAYIQFKQAKKLGIKCLYDLPIIHWRTYQRLLQSEELINPEWAETLGNTFRDSKEKLKRKDEELTLADHIFVASTFTKYSIEQDFPYQHADISVVPYGFPDIYKDRIYTSVKDRKIRFLYVGRLSQAKGLSYMFKAFDKFKAEIELTLVGQRSTNKCQVLNEALAENNYLGILSHDEVLKEMRNNDVLIFPSLFEGFGMVVTEAMSQGTPVLTTNRTCGVNFIENGENGWIVNAADVEQLQIVIQSIIDNRERLADIGRKAMRTAEQRPWLRYEEELSSKIKELL